MVGIGQKKGVTLKKVTPQYFKNIQSLFFMSWL